MGTIHPCYPLVREFEDGNEREWIVWVYLPYGTTHQEYKAESFNRVDDHNHHCYDILLFDSTVQSKNIWYLMHNLCIYYTHQYISNHESVYGMVDYCYWCCYLYLMPRWWPYNIFHACNMNEFNWWYTCSIEWSIYETGGSRTWSRALFIPPPFFLIVQQQLPLHEHQLHNHYLHAAQPCKQCALARATESRCCLTFRYSCVPLHSQPIGSPLPPCTISVLLFSHMFFVCPYLMAVF